MADVEPADGPIELEPSTGTPLRPDLRPLITPLPPVRIVAVADVHLPAAIGREEELDGFYVDILRFERTSAAGDTLAYQAENVTLIFDLGEPPIDRDNLAPTPLEVPSLRDLRDALIEREIDFRPMHGLMPATEYMLVRDPAGNGLAISGWRLFS